MPVFNPSVPPPVPQPLLVEAQPLPVELQPLQIPQGGNLTQAQYGNPLSAADWDQIQQDLSLADTMFDNAPHTNNNPLKWRDQLEQKDCPVFSGKSLEDVVDWI